MKFVAIFLIVLSLLALFTPTSEARPGKVPIGAIKKGAKVVGNGLKALNIASTANDVYKFFHHKKH